jgi:Putative zinc-finger
MRECWPDGALRAFIDRELPQEDLKRLSAHLGECARCSGRWHELSARAERVGALVSGLAEPDGVELPVRRAEKTVTMPRAHAGRWAATAGIAAALAAGWAALALLTPTPVQAPAEKRVQASATIERTPAAEVASAPEPLPVHTPDRVAPPRPVRRAFPAAPARASLAGFVPLDDDPIDSGVVMRVALAEGRMQADVIYSPDGRPRAIRLVEAGK